MSEEQYQYWQHTQLTVDVTLSRGASFFLGISLDIRFRLFTDKDRDNLTAVQAGAMMV